MDKQLERNINNCIGQLKDDIDDVKSLFGEMEEEIERLEIENEKLSDRIAELEQELQDK